MKMALKKRNQKGFTLVEIIVVLVILAILAAVLIPTMLGFVDDSRGKAEIANARTAYIAAQMIATERSAGGALDTAIKTELEKTIANDKTSKLNQLVGTDLAGAKITAVTVTGGKVSALTYLDAKGAYQVVISGGASAVVTKIK